MEGAGRSQAREREAEESDDDGHGRDAAEGRVDVEAVLFWVVFGFGGGWERPEFDPPLQMSCDH